MDRELTYQVPFDRLRKLGRRSGRKAYPYLWAIRWGLLAVFLAALFLMAQFDEAVQRWQTSLGLPPLTALITLLVVYIGVIYVMRRIGVRETKARADFQSDIRLRRDDGGIRIATDEIEYYLKWRGISQMFMEHDGVVLSHGNLFFLVPDGAFNDKAERDAFIGDVFVRLGPEAQGRSRTALAPVLGASAAAGP